MIRTDKVGVRREYFDNLEWTTGAIRQFVDDARRCFGLNRNMDFDDVANSKLLLCDGSIMTETMIGATLFDKNFKDVGSKNRVSGDITKICEELRV